MRLAWLTCVSPPSTIRFFQGSYHIVQSRRLLSPSRLHPGTVRLSQITQQPIVGYFIPSGTSFRTAGPRFRSIGRPLAYCTKRSLSRTRNKRGASHSLKTVKVSIMWCDSLAATPETHFQMQRPHLLNCRHLRKKVRPRTHDLRLNLPEGHPCTPHQLNSTRSRSFWTGSGALCGVYSIIVTADAPLRSVGACRVPSPDFSLPLSRLSRFHEILLMTLGRVMSKSCPSMRARNYEIIFDSYFIYCSFSFRRELGPLTVRTRAYGPLTYVFFSRILVTILVQAHRRSPGFSLGIALRMGIRRPIPICHQR